MRKVRVSIAVLVLLPLMLFTTGCPKSTTSAYTAALKGADDYAQVVGGLISVGQDLYQAKLIDVNEYRVVMQASTELDVYGSGFLDTIIKLHQDPSTGATQYLNAANTVVTEVTNLNINAALHVKNPTAQAKLNVALQAVSTFITGISLRIANASPTAITPVPVPAPPAPVATTPPATPAVTPTPTGGK